MKLLKYTILIFAVILVSCSDEQSGSVAPTELIKSVNASVNSSNALRVNVAIEFRKKVTYQIQYWKQGSDKNKKTTLAVDASSSALSTLVFLEPNTFYDFQILASTESASTISEVYTFRTGTLPGNISTYTLPVDNMETDLPGYILLAKRDSPGFIAVTDTKGTVVWYESVPKGVRVVNYDPKTKYFVAITGGNSEKAYAGDGVFVVDLCGNVILDRESKKLYPHHDSRLLPDGDIILVNYVPKKYDLSSQGGGTEDIVWGDGYTIMDINGNIKKQWDCFNELNPQNDPDIMKTKGDWLHANSVNYDSEGNYYMTFNAPSELWKIDKQTGAVYYRVGRKGNVAMDAAGFANGLHSPYLLDVNKILVLDNGSNTGTSRALVYSVDQTAKKATVSFEVAFPKEYGSANRSNAQIIKDNLIVLGSSTAMSVVFTDFEGKVLRVIGCNYPPFRADYIPEIKY